MHLTDIFWFLHAIGQELSLTLPTAAHIEHAEAVVMRQVLNNVQWFKATTAQAMQIHNAFTIKQRLVVLNASSPMLDQCAFDPFIPPVFYVMKILDHKSFLIEVES